MRTLRTLGILASVLAIAGCISDSQAVKLNADGSGTLTSTTVMKTAALEKMKKMIEEMAKAFGGAQAQGKPPELFSEDEAKGKAAKMGEGVEFVSAEKIKTKDEEGIKATYKFKDITKLKIKSQPDPPGGGAGPGLGPQAPQSDPITFKFARQAGGNLLLTVVNPAKKAEAAAKEAPPAVPPGAEPPAEAQLAMMKEMMGGLKMSLTVEVAGRIVKTNSPHVSGSTVTILEMDFDKMLGDMDKMKELMAASPKSLEEAKALMKEFPGVKVNLEPEVTVEFAP